MRLRRRKDKPDDGAETVVRDAEGDPVEDPTVSGILPPLDAGAEPGGEAVSPPPPPPLTEPAPEAPAAIEPEPEPAAEMPPPESAPIPEPIPGPEPVPEPGPEPPAPEPGPVVAEPEPTPEPAAPEAEPVAAPPEAVGYELPEPPPASVAAPASRSGGRPELLVGAAFVGGVAVATVLRRLGRR